MVQKLFKLGILKIGCETVMQWVHLIYNPSDLEIFFFISLPFLPVG